MTTRSKITVALGCVLVLTGAALFWSGTLQEPNRSSQQEGPQTGAPAAIPGGGTEPASGPSEMTSREEGPAPDRGASGVEPSGTARDLPASPPLPDMPPQSSEKQRKEAFGLRESVDHILLPNESFQVEGKKTTIDEILGLADVKKDLERLFPSIREGDIGASIKEPIIKSPPGRRDNLAYYGVRVVRPGENLWEIHFGVIREYFARRQVHVELTADRPDVFGRSSGVARLLKFIEGVVFVYDLRRGRLEEDLNMIAPNTVVVFFKISDLFGALDRLEYADLKWLHLVKNDLRLEKPAEQIKLLERKALLPQ